MHPILARTGRLALYLGLWVIVGLLLAGLLAAQTNLGWAASAMAALPLATAYSFVCLSAWYVARGMSASCRWSIGFWPSSASASAIGCGSTSAPVTPAGAGFRPLLLQPIVENAVTHGIAHVLEGGTVRVTVEQVGGTLRLAVENPCDPDRPRRSGAGVGLANVRARLQAVYGTDAWMTAGESGDSWQVQIGMPATDASV